MSGLELKSKINFEIWQCAEDPIYFIENYCKVEHPTRGLVPFKLYDYQKNAIKAMLVNDRLIVNKARQLGFTTLTAAFVTWLMLFHNNKKILVVSINAEVAKGMVAKIKVMLKHLPDWMYLATFDIDRAHKIGLSNGSSVESIARSDNAGRSLGMSLVIIDEAAIIRDMDQLYTALKSTVSTGGKIFAMSTPKGMGNWFQKTWAEAQSGENDWTTFLTNWWECPEYATDLEKDEEGKYTSSWFRKFTKDMSKLQIAQELLTSFVESGDTYFEAETIAYWSNNSIDPIRRIAKDKCLWIWKEPELNETYLISADCSTGAGEDYSTFHVINLRTMEVCAEFRGKIYPDLFAELLIETGKMYNTAWIAPESTNVGYATSFHIKNLAYPKLVFLDKDFSLVDKWFAESHGILPGVPMDVRNRGHMITKLEEYLRQKKITVYSKRLVNEMHTFALINNKPQAAKSQNAHDDLIMALAIGVWLKEIIPEFNGINSGLNQQEMLKLITISKQTYNYSQVEREQRINEMRRNLEKNGATILQPNIYGRHIFFTK